MAVDAEVIERDGVRFVPGAVGDTLVFSMRQIAHLVANAVQCEYEDLICKLTGADRVEPVDTQLVENKRRLYKAAHALTGSGKAVSVVPKLGSARIERDYELFVAVFNNAWEVFALQALGNWRQRCKKAVCVIVELWEDELPDYLLKSLSDFDQIFINTNPVKSVARYSGRPCEFLGLGVDAKMFCPFPNPPDRSLDILNIGRRSPQTHSALMAHAREHNLFYYYDTARIHTPKNKSNLHITFTVIDPAEHRFKYASMLKRSKYFMASRALANDPRRATDQVSGRFFEGAAAGAIMIGEEPTGGPFFDLFDWPDSLINRPFDDPDVVDVIRELDADPERRWKARQNSIVNSLRRHDWGWRLAHILNWADMQKPSPLSARLDELEALATQVEAAQLSG